jgi:hypothetical protein
MTLVSQGRDRSQLIHLKPRALPAYKASKALKDAKRTMKWALAATCKRHAHVQTADKLIQNGKIVAPIKN